MNILTRWWRGKTRYHKDPALNASKRRRLERDIRAGVDLMYEDFSNADLGGMDLSHLNLTGADLSHSLLTRANLNATNLSYADLSYTDLSCANCTDAILTGAGLEGAITNDAFGLNPNIVCPLRLFRDQPGTIRLYKLVFTDGVAPDDGPAIHYVIGAVVESPDADTNEYDLCSRGINVATLDWCMKRWQFGYRILTVDFTASDIAAIPITTNGMIRLYRGTVSGEKDLEAIGLISKKEAKLAYD